MRTMTDDPAKKKEEFLTEIYQVKSDAVRFEALGQDIARIGRYVRDVAGPLGDLVAALPPENLPADALQRESDGWRAFRLAAEEVEKVRPVITSLSAMSLAS